MILEYSYDKANEVLDLLNKSQIASLTVTKAEDTYVMEYTEISEYPEAKQSLIRKVLSEALPQRLKLVNLMNQFVEKQILGLVDDFTIKFNAVNVRQCEFKYSYGFNDSVIQKQEPIQIIETYLEQLERTVINMGASEQQVPAYRKEGTGRNKKYVQLTMQEFIATIRKTLEE